MDSIICIDENELFVEDGTEMDLNVLNIECFEEELIGEQFVDDDMCDDDPLVDPDEPDGLVKNTKTDQNPASVELAYFNPDPVVRLSDPGIPWFGDLPKRKAIFKSKKVDDPYVDPPPVDPPPVDPPPGGGGGYPWTCITSIPEGSEGINTINSDLAWSIKLTRAMVQWIGSDGFGSHMGPFLVRERVGLSFWYYSDGATIIRAKWGGNQPAACPPVDPPTPIIAPPYIRYDQQTPGDPDIDPRVTWPPWPNNGYHGSYHLRRGTARSSAVTNYTQRQDPDGIFWLTPAKWAAAEWDGVPKNPCTNSLSVMKAWLFPDPNTLRGLRQRYYECNPFTDLKNPTPAEIDSWNIEVIRHFRRLLGLPNPIYPDRSLFKRAQWASEAYQNKRYNADGVTGVCQGSSNQHCGATYLPACGVLDTYGGAPGQNTPYYRFPNET